MTNIVKMDEHFEYGITAIDFDKLTLICIRKNKSFTKVAKKTKFFFGLFTFDDYDYEFVHVGYKIEFCTGNATVFSATYKLNEEDLCKEDFKELCDIWNKENLNAISQTSSPNTTG